MASKLASKLEDISHYCTTGKSEFSDVGELVKQMQYEAKESECWHSIISSLNHHLQGEFDPDKITALKKNCLALLDAGMNINHVDPDGRTPLIAALEQGLAATSILLVECGADVNACFPNTKKTALSTALRNGTASNFVDVVPLLLREHAVLDGTTELWDKDVFQFPINVKELDIMSALLNQFESTHHAVPWWEIFQDAVNGDFEKGALEIIYRGYHMKPLDLSIHKQCCGLAARKRHLRLLRILVLQHPAVILDDSWTENSLLPLAVYAWIRKVKRSVQAQRVGLQAMCGFVILANLSRDHERMIETLPLPNSLINPYLWDLLSIFATGL